jgi:hypothetical protein
MSSKRQNIADKKAQSRALAKRKQDLIIATDQHYRMTAADDEATLRSMSTSPDLSGSIRLARALLQLGIESRATPRQQAELLRICHTLCRVQISIILQLGLLLPDTTLIDYGTVVVEVAREIFQRHGGGGVEELETAIRAILERTNLAAVNESDEVAELSGGQTYNLGDKQSVYEQSSATLSQSADLALCRFYIQKSLDDENIGAVILLLRQEMAMAATQLAFGQKSGELLSRTAGRVIVLEIGNRVSEALKSCDDFEVAIDEFRALLTARFNPRIEQQ